MFELMIMRHAKSDWDAGSANDHERPLSKRGSRAAQKMGDFLAKAGRVPDIALSSTAMRAHSTAQTVLRSAAAAGHEVPKLSKHSELYGASVDEWLLCVSSALFQREPTRVLVAGHEPTCSSVLRVLTGTNARFPTGTVATVRVEDPRQLAVPESHRAPCLLEALVIPRLLD